MKHIRTVTGFVTLSALLGAGSAAAIDPSASDPRAILSAARRTQSATRSTSRIRMTIQSKAGTRERVFSTRAKRYDDAYKTLLVIEQPADLRDTGFLTIDYQTRGRADEQWIYLPKLHRVSRLAASGKADSFVGSDFTISDMSAVGSDLDDYDLKLVAASVSVDGDDCWQIETKPRDAATKSKTGYDRTQLWVSKSKLIVLQFKGWVSDNKKTKYLKVLDVRKVQGIWTPHRLQMRTLQGSELLSETQLEVLKIDQDAKEVSDSDFTEQRLQQGV